MFRFPEQELVQLNSLGHHQPRAILFIIAGIEGHCAVFQSLATALATHHMLVFGLEYTLRVPCTSIPQTARFYIQQIRRQLDQLDARAFQLAGFSYGNPHLNHLL